MKSILENEIFNIISAEDKAFIIAFDDEITKFGYDSGGNIGSGFCWGKYMIIYSKTGVKNKQVAARIYIREEGIILRLFLNKIDKHRKYIEDSSAYIKDVFINEHGKCQHCHDEKGGNCKFRKAYTINNNYYEKCNGMTFEFRKPDLKKLGDYIGLLREFYPVKKKINIK